MFQWTKLVLNTIKALAYVTFSAISVCNTAYSQSIEFEKLAKSVKKVNLDSSCNAELQIKITNKLLPSDLDPCIADTQERLLSHGLYQTKTGQNKVLAESSKEILIDVLDLSLIRESSSKLIKDIKPVSIKIEKAKSNNE